MRRAAHHSKASCGRMARRLGVVLLATAMIACAFFAGGTAALASDDELVYVLEDPDPAAERKEFGGHFYQCINEHMSWHDAEEYCESIGGHLVTIGSQEENEFVFELIQEQTGRDFYWLGGTDEEEEGTWVWVTGEPWEYVTWDWLEPSNSGGDETGEDFLSMWATHGGTWNDQWVKDPSYGELVGFVCEWESDLLTVSVHVTDPSGNAIWSGYTVAWYAQDGKLLGTGQRLFNAAAQTAYTCAVTLGEELSREYVQPESVSFQTGDQGQAVPIVLHPLERMSVLGTVRGEDGGAVPYASLRLKQTFSGQYAQSQTAEANDDGSFAFVDVAKTKSTLVVTADGYYDGYFPLPEEPETGEVHVDAVLRRLPSNKITLTLYKQEAALPGQAKDPVQLTNANGLAFSAYNESRWQNIDDLKVQYPYVMLPEGAAEAGDVIRLSVADQSGDVTAQDIEVRLDGSRCAEAEWTLTQNGRISLTGISGSQKHIVMVFDQAGRCVANKTVASAFTSEPLARGDYAVVVLEWTPVLRSVDSLQRLAQAGLVEQADYALRAVSVDDGVITEVGGVEVPDLDEARFAYTIQDKTMLLANKSEATAWQYVTMKASYEVDEKHRSEGQTVSLEIPAGMVFVSRSLTVDGKPATCTVVDDAGGCTVSVPVNQASGTVRFYVIPTEPGTRTVYAYLSFEGTTFAGDVGQVTQSIGSAHVEVLAASIKVPKKTGKTTVAASGKAAANCDVTVYDNGTPVGRTTSNKSGSWSLEFDLVYPRKFSRHEVYAEVASEEYGVSVQTDVAELIYNCNYSQLSKITMINTAHPATSLDPVEFRTVFDVLHPTGAVPTYNYWPEYPTFTFVVEFTEGAADSVSNVSVVTTDSYGDKTRVPCTYDEASGTWIGTCDYPSFSDVPRKVSVRCANVSGVDCDFFIDAEEVGQMAAEARSLGEELSDVFGDAIEVRNLKQDAGMTSFDLQADGECVLSYSAEQLDFDEWSSSHAVEGDAGPDGVRFLFEDVNGASVFYVVDAQNKTVLRETLSDASDAKGAAKTRGGSVRDHLKDYAQRIDAYVQRLRTQVNVSVDSALCCRCCYSSMAERAKKEGHRVVDQFSADLFRVILPLLNTDWDAIPEPEAESMNAWAAMIEARFQALVEYYTDLVDFTIESHKVNGRFYCDMCNTYCRYDDCDCPRPDDDEDEDEDGDEEQGEDHPTDPIADPSGYVYEAVPSNRVEGVKAEVYQYDYAVDEFGVPEDQKSEILWDAQSYDQANPQYTSEDGSFGWDVPEGQWMVRFSKDGYRDANTRQDVACDEEGYLPVPPIQTEVNTAIVSEDAPKVRGAWAHGEGVRIEFDRYMQIESVCAAGAVVVTCDGKAVGGVVEPLDAEYDYEGVNQYASAFAFRANKGLSGTVTVAVEGAVAYNGLAMTSGYREDCFVKPLPQDIELRLSNAVAHHGSATVDVQVIPAEAGAGQELLVESLSPSIVGLGGGSVVVDQDGRARIPVEGMLPGRGVLRVSLDGTDVRKSLAVQVLAGGEEPEVVDISGCKIALGSSSFVYDGSEHRPAVTVTLGGKELASGADYLVSYANNVNAGTATVTVEGVQSAGYAGTATASFAIERAAQTISASSKTVAMGKTLSLGAKNKTVGGGALSYKSKSTKICKVSSKGVVTPVGVGKTTVTVTAAAKGNYRATSKTVTVTVAKGTQTIKAAGLECVIGKTAKIGAKASGGGKLTYKSSNVKVAAVSAKGVVTGKKAGSVTVTVTAAATANWKKATKKVSVKVGKANPLVASAKKKVVTVAYNKKKAVVTAANVKVAKAQGTVRFSNASAGATAKKFSVNAKTGKVTVPKGTKKGKYTVKVSAKAAGNKSYISRTRTVSYTIQVK